MDEGKTCIDEEVSCIVDGVDLLKHLALIKKYVFENDKERAYLCADYIEQELHKVIYGNTAIDWDWKKP